MASPLAKICMQPRDHQPSVLGASLLGVEWNLKLTKDDIPASSQWVHVPYGQASLVPSFALIDNQQLTHDLVLGFRGLIDFGRRNPYNPDSSCQGVRPTPKSTSACRGYLSEVSSCSAFCRGRGSVPPASHQRAGETAGVGVPASPPSCGSPFEPRVSSSGASSRPGRTTLFPFPVPVIPTPRYARSLPDKALFSSSRHARRRPGRCGRSVGQAKCLLPFRWRYAFSSTR
jgi:hypothetical protein